METVYKVIKTANPAAIRYYSDSDVLETDGPKNTRVFNLVKALYDKGLVEKMAFHGHMRFGKNNPPPQTPEELAAFKNKLKGRMRPYLEAGIPIGINELDVIFLNGSGISEANQQTITGKVMATTLEAYLEILGEAKKTSIRRCKKTND